MNIKSQKDLQIMAEGGGKLASIRDALLERAAPGVSLLEIEGLASSLIGKSGGTASFKTVDGYKWSTCLCVNDVVVHGIPTEYKLQEGDLLTVDVGLLYKGLHTDTAWSITVGGDTHTGVPRFEHFRKTGEHALVDAIKEATVGRRVGHISQVIERVIEGSGYHVIRALVGHGVGKLLHEEPQVPGVLRSKVEETPELYPGMTIAIEVIYAEGGSSVVYKGEDGWSIATRDGSLSAVFEHTVAVTTNGPVVLTRGKV